MANSALLHSPEGSVSDFNKDWTPKYQDKDKDQTFKDKDKDKDLKLVLRNPQGQGLTSLRSVELFQKQLK